MSGENGAVFPPATTSTALVLLCALGAATPARAGNRFTVQVDPLTTAIGFLHVQVEYAVTPQLSVYLSPHLRLFDGILENINGDYVGVGVEAVVRFFVWGRAPAGWWLGPRGVLVRLASRSEVRAGGYASFLCGYTWILADRWVLALGLGISYFDYRIDTADVRGFLPAAHTALGVSF